MFSKTLSRFLAHGPSRVFTRPICNRLQPIRHAASSSDTSQDPARPQQPKEPRKPQVRPSIEPLCNCDSPNTLSKCTKSIKCQYRVEGVPVYIKTYGCQMNENDSAIVAAILESFGYRIVDDDSKAEIHLLMTCAIRNSAESKIWGKLHSLKRLKDNPQHPLKQIGLLGCMAERLKERVLETSALVDIVAGPDAYRDLPRLFSVNRMTQDKAINCLLSFDETYSDIRPVTNVNDVSSYISITRGCDNLCSYCIVPFTRGKERSRPLMTIVDEARQVHNKGIKEVILLGQNVNSYRDLATNPETIGRPELVDRIGDVEYFAEGFKTVYKPRIRGLTFDVLLEEVAKISPELRVRFTSPHPKDFNSNVIDVIRRYQNISRCIHLPAQSGSNRVLKKMRRGYTREAYLSLVSSMRKHVPDLSLTGDFIAGFCSETEEDHHDTLDLIEQVKYNFIFAFPYSMRDKTHAFHNYQDNVDSKTKSRRVAEILELFRQHAFEINSSLIGTDQLVLVESESRRSSNDWAGRIDSNVRTNLPKGDVLDLTSMEERPIRLGDYVVCEIIDASSQTLKGRPLHITTQLDYFRTKLQRNARVEGIERTI